MPTIETLNDLCKVGMGIAYHAKQSGSTIAIESTYGRRSFAELNADANRLARLLRDAGIVSGDAIACAVKNRPEYLVIVLAAQRMGARLTPINYNLNASEIGYILENCDAVAFFADVELAERAGQARLMAPAVRIAIATGGTLPQFKTFDDELARYSSSDILEPTLGGRMLYTSGTTGRPRGVIRSATIPILPQYEGTLANYRRYEDKVLCTGPGYHGAPLLLNLLQPLISGVGVVWMDRWNAEAALGLIAERRITHTHMVPTMLHRLLQLPERLRTEADISSLRLLLHGAAPISTHTKTEIIKWFGDRVWEYYAATEGDNVFFVSANEWLQRPGTVGRPPPERGIRILDESGRELPTSEPGFIYMPAPAQGRFSYYKDTTKTAAAYVDGYYTVGDIGYLDADGYLFITGRTADTIISGGVNIYPQEVDNVLLGHPAVIDACTVGIPDEEWGEVAKSVVVLNSGFVAHDALKAELIAWTRRHLASFKCPRSIDVVEDLPRLAAGKVKRNEVRDWYRGAASPPTLAHAAPTTEH